MLPMSGGSEFQRRGEEHLKGLLPMVARRGEGTERGGESEGLGWRGDKDQIRRIWREVVDGLERVCNV